MNLKPLEWMLFEWIVLIIVQSKIRVREFGVKDFVLWIDFNMHDEIIEGPKSLLFLMLHHTERC